jgi:structural maintenance of chromosome 2
MRPQEILGMVEEAAGTRMFEERKDKAKKTMGKKDKRVQEIKDILSEEITPKLNKLRNEKRSYIQYQKSASELERIDRTIRAGEWLDTTARVAEKQEEIEKEEERIQQLAANKKQALKNTTNAEKEVASVTKKRNEEMSKGGKLKKLQEEVGDLGKALAKMKAQVEIKTGSIKDEEARVATTEVQLKEVRKLSHLLYFSFETNRSIYIHSRNRR